MKRLVLATLLVLGVASARVPLLALAPALVAFVTFVPFRKMTPAVIAISAGIPASLLGAWVGDPALRARLLISRDSSKPVDAVFVLSGDVDFHRTIYGAEVFRETGARWFIVSGAGAGGDSGALMADAARAEAIPEEALVVETRATTTRENVLFVQAEIAKRGIETIAVVTSPYHSRRASLAARRAWPSVRVISRPVPDSHPLSCRDHATRDCEKMADREREKLLGYLLRGWL